MSNWYREYQKLLEGALNEGVTFAPAQKSGNNISWPEGYEDHIKEPCRGCEYYHEYHPDVKVNPNCEDCGGKGYETHTVYKFPHMDVSSRSGAIITSMLGDYDDEHGWIPFEELPIVRRTLIRIINGDTEQYSVEPSDTQKTIVDRDGPVPMIRKSARMIDGGVSGSQAKAYAERLLGIVEWAQKNNCGLSWA